MLRIVGQGAKMGFEVMVAHKEMYQTFPESEQKSLLY